MKKMIMIIAGLALMGQGCTWFDSGRSGVQTETDSRVGDVLEAEPSDPTPREENTDKMNPEIEADSGATATVSASISDFTFQPNAMRVKQGSKIVFTNRDSIGHTVTADQGAAFDSGLLMQGQSFTLDTALLAKGSYGFHCAPHPQMKGTVVVE